jgi:hypothetical protein
MNTTVTQPTPREAVAAVLFLKDEVLKGKLTLAPLLKRKLLEIGLYSDKAWRTLMEQGRASYESRTRDSFRAFQADIDAVGTLAVANADFRGKVQAYVDRVYAARSEAEVHRRINALKSFLEEFGFYNEELMRNALGNVLYEKHTERLRKAAEEPDETESEMN